MHGERHLPDERRYTIRFDPDFHKRLKIAVADRDIRSIQEAVVQSLEQWLDRDATGSDTGPKRTGLPKVPSKDRQIVDALLRILESGDKTSITAVRSCLALAEEHIKPRSKR
jgi:hypothetical protein